MEFNKQRQVLEYVSGYFKILLRRFPEYGHWLWDKHQINRIYSLLELNSDLATEIKNNNNTSINSLALSLRRFKQRHFLRIGARDLLGLDDLKSTVQQISDIAIVALQTCTKFLMDQPHLWLDSSESSDINILSKHVELAIIGLGKLGGKELNYGSDIDLMFLYDINETENSLNSRELSLVAQKLLPKFCTQIIHLLEHNYEGDRVFKVDLRLRPTGKDGELISPLSYAIHHYLVEGRSWERLALLKATPVAGSLTTGNLFIQEIQPFVFRRFLDFQSLEEIKLLRNKILDETFHHSPGPGFNVKLGRGGIREIEFIVQSLQLIYGGRNPALRTPNTLQALKILTRNGLLDESTSAKLISAYEFFRKTEHWIQLMDNQRSQTIPKNSSSLARLAFAVMYSHCLYRKPEISDAENMVNDFLETLKKHTNFVHSCFTELFEPYKKAENSHNGTFKLAKGFISKFEIKNPQLKNRLSGLLEENISGEENKKIRDEILNRCERFLSAISRRPGLTTFFDKQPDIFDLCIRGLIKSEFIAELLTHVPSLCEGIERNVRKPWIDAAQSILSGFESLEEKLHWLRRIKNERLLSIALYDVVNNPDGETIENLLSELADFTIIETYRLVCNDRNIAWKEFPLAICAMGKLGSSEFNYTSDLDLVFVYDPPLQENQEVIPERVTKLVQRFVRFLSIPLSEGPGYEVDMRLRPTGNYGPLIVTKKAWGEYYENDADIWELASLVRFRPVCGKAELISELSSTAKKFIKKKRKSENVWTRLCSLKKRVEAERSKSANHAKRIDIKLGPGGIMDVELWCQGSIIAWPEIIYEDSMSTRKLFEPVMKFWKIDNSAMKQLAKAFDILKRLEQRIALAALDAKSFDMKQFEKMKLLGLLSTSELGDSLEWSDVTTATSRIRKWWERVCYYKKPLLWRDALPRV